MKKTYNTSWNPFEIQYRVEDESSNQGLDFLFSHTNHSKIRSSQRGINSDKIIVALVDILEHTDPPVLSINSAK